ncbi:unnamed protein product [Mytilus coruscus]|uniref:Novel STAND NTPase 3 domain-containing protein n=1 Tax=Mytilus coruscus TaxID=42192 RepID=A0A6J8E3R8_MYTCO|nr:unnamed protein product [Mytilus coruscus]
MMKYIDQLVNARNTVFAHTTKGELSDEDFRQLWNEIENSIVYLSKITGTDLIRTRRILELREESLEEFSCLEIQCLILRQMHEDEQIIRECHKIQGTVKLLKEDIVVKLEQIELQMIDFKSIMKDNIQSELSEQLEEYSDNSGREIEFHNNDKTYVKTAAVTAAIELLDKENILIIIGRAGSGKSSAALEISSIFRAKGYIVMNLEQHLAKDFKTYFLCKNKQFIIFEDLFGKSDIRYNEDIHSNLLDAVKPHVNSGQSKFIITLRSYKPDDVDRTVTGHELLSEAAIININGNFSLSALEKRAILINHAKHHGHFRSNKTKMLDDVDIQNIIKTNPYLGFPEACRLFCSFEQFFAMGHTFFTSPIKELQCEIRRLKRSGYDKTDSALQYCVLVSLMLDRACEGSFGMKTVVSCSWQLINLFIYPTAFKIKNAVIGIYTNDTWLIQRFINEILKPKGDKLLSVRRYIEDYGCDELVKDFNEKFAESFKSDETKVSLSWHLINVFIYPTAFKMKNAVIGIHTNDSLLIQRLINEIVKPNEDNLLAVQRYIDSYGCEEFVKDFNEKLAEWFQTKKALLSSSWNLIDLCVRPSTFKIQNGKIGINTKDSWLIQRYIGESIKPDADKLSALRSYITKYGCKEFVMDFNTKSFQTEETVVNGAWDLINHFVRPTTFKIWNDELGTHTKDSWLIQSFINKILKPKPENLWAVYRYIEDYGCKEFIKDFNRQLSKLFQSGETVEKCSWHLINLFIYPVAFKIRHDAIGIHINDNWLIQRFINEIVKPKADKLWAVRNYIAKNDCEEFVNDFNDKLSESFQSEGTVVYCSWYLINLFIYPSAFKIKNAVIGIHTNDSWLIQRLINEIVKPKADNLLSVQRYIEDYGCEEFVKGFHEKKPNGFRQRQI